MAFLIRNLSLSSVVLDDLGITVPGSPQDFEVTDLQPNDIAISTDLTDAISGSPQLLAIISPLDDVTVLSQADSLEVVLATNDSHWGIRAGTLDQLDDVDTAGGTPGDVLTLVGSPTGVYEPRAAGAALTDGIGISSSGSVLDLDVDDLAIASIVGSDFLAFHDGDGSPIEASGSVTRKITATNFIADLGLGAGGGASAISASDGVQIVLVGSPQVQDVRLDFTNLPADTIVRADELAFFDVSGSPAIHNKTTALNFLANLNIINNVPGTGVVVQTGGSPQYVTRSVAVEVVGSPSPGLNGLVVSNGDGIAGNPTLGLDIQNLPVLSDAADATDRIAVYNISTGVNEYYTISQLPVTLNTDGIGISSSGLVFDLDVDDLAIASITGSDFLAFHDGDGSPVQPSGSVTRKITAANFISDLGLNVSDISASDGVQVILIGSPQVQDIRLDVNGLLADTIVGADELAFFDVSGSPAIHNKTTASNFLADLNVINNVPGTGAVIQTGGSPQYVTRSIAVEVVGSPSPGLNGLVISNADGIAGDPTLGLDIQNLPVLSDAADATDRIAVYNISTGVNEYYAISQLPVTLQQAYDVGTAVPQITIIAGSPSLGSPEGTALPLTIDLGPEPTEELVNAIIANHVNVEGSPQAAVGYATSDVITLALGTGGAGTAAQLTVDECALFSAVVNAGGTNHEVGDFLTLSLGTGGAGTAATLEVLSITPIGSPITTGAVATVDIRVVAIRWQGAYTTTPSPTTGVTVASTTGSGTGATFDLTFTPTVVSVTDGGSYTAIPTTKNSVAQASVSPTGGTGFVADLLDFTSTDIFSVRDASNVEVLTVANDEVVTKNIIPSGNALYDIGQKFDPVNGDNVFKTIRSTGLTVGQTTTAGEMDITGIDTRSVVLNMNQFGITGNYEIKATAGALINAPILAAFGQTQDRIIVEATGAPSTILSCFSINYTGGANVTQTNKTIASGQGSVVNSYINAGFANGVNVVNIVEATGTASVCFGGILNFSALNFQATVSASGTGSFVQGFINPPTTDSNFKFGLIQATANGSMARGFVANGTIESTGLGSFASGRVGTSGSSQPTLRAIAAGAVALGSNSGGGMISAQGGGSFIAMNSTSLGDNKVTGNGSVLFGANTGGSVNSHITNSGEGSLSVIHTENASNQPITLAGSGSLDILNITGAGATVGASTVADGSILVADVGTNQRATIDASNAGQIGLGDNNIDNSFKVGLQGEGIWLGGVDYPRGMFRTGFTFFGSPVGSPILVGSPNVGSPAITGPVNGQIWTNGGVIQLHSNGNRISLDQQSGTGETAGFTATTGSPSIIVNDTSTFTGNVSLGSPTIAYRINDIVKALKNQGLLQ